jgi:hypothetical protein
MNIIKDEATDTVRFTNFTNETNIVFLLILRYLKEKDIKYIQTPNTINISRYDFDVMKATLGNELFH